MVPGLITRAFFDSLTAAALAGFSVWGLIALLMGFTLARVMTIFLGFVGSFHGRFLASGLLRRNMLKRVLERPGPRPCPNRPARPSAGSGRTPSWRRMWWTGRWIRSGCLPS